MKMPLSRAGIGGRGSSTASSSTINLGIRSSEGRQRLQISATATGVTLKAEIRKLLNLDQDFNV